MSYIGVTGLLHGVLVSKTLCMPCRTLTLPASRISSLVFETFLFALTLAVFLHSLRRRKREHKSIVYVLVRDGTWAFGLIFGKPNLDAATALRPDLLVQSQCCSIC